MSYLWKENSVTFQGTVGTITNFKKNKHKNYLKFRKQHYKNTRNNQFKKTKHLEKQINK